MATTGQLRRTWADAYVLIVGRLAAGTIQREPPDPDLVTELPSDSDAEGERQEARPRLARGINLEPSIPLENKNYRP